MIEMKEIKKAVNMLLKDFNYKIYGLEVTEGFEKPAFFTELVLQEEESININTFKRTVLCTITFFQKKSDEADALNKFELIRKKLISEKTRMKPMLSVCDRLILVSDLHINYTGEKRNIPQYIFTLEYLDKEEIIEKQTVIHNVEFRLEG